MDWPLKVVEKLSLNWRWRMCVWLKHLLWIGTYWPRLAILLNERMTPDWQRIGMDWQGLAWIDQEWHALARIGTDWQTGRNKK